MPEFTAPEESRPVRVAIAGVGNVGATFAYALLLSGLAAEIVLIDARRAKAEGEAMDLNHTVPFTHPTRIWAGDYVDCAGAAVTVLAARFRFLLSQHFGVDARSVHAYIIGEHGDSEVPACSLANIAGMHLSVYCRVHGLPYEPQQMEKIFVATRDAAYHIIERKGATYYAVAAGLLSIVQSILRHQNTVLSVSSLIENYHGISNVCFSLPTVVDRGGIRQVLGLELDETEVAKLRRSADVLKETIAALDLD
jgi:malate/lactate dehydrogenase